MRHTPPFALPVLAAALLACGGDSGSSAGPEPELPPIPPSNTPLPQLGTDASRRFVQVAGRSDGLLVPRDLAFHPTRPGELWTVNLGFEGTVTFYTVGTARQRISIRSDEGMGLSMAPAGQAGEVKMDSHRSHFMQQVIGISMGANGTFGTCQEGVQQFMGPTLWDSDPAVYAKHDLPGWGTLGSHIDMLHQTPQCLGIEHERDNIFWVSDGTYGNLVRYDFRRDHGPGHDDHSDGVVRRYAEAKVSRVAGVPGHMVLDRATGWLYYADPGGRRVVRIATASGSQSGTLQPYGERIDYAEVKGAKVEVVVSQGLSRPSGIALYGGNLFVTDNATNEIVAFDLAGRELQRVKTPAQGIMGIAAAPDGKLWYVDGGASRIVRVDPK